MEYSRVTQASEHPVLAKPLGPAKLAGGHLQGVQIQTLSLGPITDALVKLVIGLDHHPLLVQVATGDGASFVASCITKVTLSTRTPRNVHMLIDCLPTCEMACPAEACMDFAVCARPSLMTPQAGRQAICRAESMFGAGQDATIRSI